MKILKIKANGLPLMKDGFEVDFYARQRVEKDDKEVLYNIFSNIYINNVVAFMGLNASGKTTILKVISFVLNMLNNKPINRIDNDENGVNKMFELLQVNENVVFEVYFYCENANGTVNKLQTIIKKVVNDMDGSYKYVISDETLWSKSISKVQNKDSLFEFEEENPIMVRNMDEEFLMEDVSIMIAFNKRNSSDCPMRDLSMFTNLNLLQLIGTFPAELIAFLDPTIEYLKFTGKEKELDIHLKFKEKDEIILNNPIQLSSYLSSGTIKGINVFMNAFFSFKDGGYLLIDELENHFNQEIVVTLIRFFMNRNVNKKGATLIFTTHYAEILDEFGRNDSIYIVRNLEGITEENLSQILTRNDIKKSEAYQSGFLRGTAPSYEAYINLKKVLQ